MIRPFTLVCMVMAGASGLYLYQSKHRAQMLDRDIGRVIKTTEQTRDRTKMLQGEWAMLNDPERLAEAAKAHLALQTLQPKQFIALADLAARLPAPVAPGTSKPGTDEPEETPAPVIATRPAAPPATASAQAPAPAAAPPPAPVAIATAHDPKPAEPRPQTASTEPKPSPVRTPKPVQTASAPAPSPPAVVARSVLTPVVPVAVSNAATAPGTVGEAVMRAMRAREAGSPQPIASYQPQPAYVQPAASRQAPAYQAPAYQAPSYQPPAYSAPVSSSLLGGSRSALAPPVPFAAR